MSPSAPLRAVVGDADPVVRAGLAALLDAAPGITVAARAADGPAAREAVLAHRPDVVLLDARMPGTGGPGPLPELAAPAPVLMVTRCRDRATVREAVRRGAAGYLVHGEFTTGQLVAAVREVAAGRTAFGPAALAALREPPRGFALQLQRNSSHVQPDVAQSSGTTDRSRFGLSRREEEVMELIASGMTNQQIAAVCFISGKTVKNHINRIFGKLRAGDRGQAVARWLGTAPPGDR